MTVSPADVIVIGGGPAAMAAAIVCARGGLRTTIVMSEREVLDEYEPRESLHPGVQTLLEELGAPGAMILASRGTYRGVWAGDTFAALGADMSGPWVGHHVVRGVFDRALAHRSEALGVRVLDRQRVVDLVHDADRVRGVRIADGTSILASHVIDASGGGRMAGKRMGFAEQMCSEPFVAWTGLVDGHVGGRTDPSFDAHADGWTWLAPEPSGRCTWTRLAARGTGEPGLPTLLARCEPRTRVRAANVRWRVFRPIVAEGLLLAGDAAGIVDPAAGQGVLVALWSGIMAARAVVQCVARPQLEALVLAEYDAWYMEQYLARTARLREHYGSLGIRI